MERSALCARTGEWWWWWGVWACVGWACEETWGMGGWACGETQGTVNGRKKMAALEINLASNSVFMTLVV